MSCDEELQGFVQCVSRIFRVKRDQTIMIKLTTDPICFCFSSQTSHVLIQWNKHEELFEDQQARIRFLNGCPIHQWIRASGLRRYRIYSGQARERVVWLFQANVSHVQVIPAPLNPPSCSQSICPSRPIGMLSTLHAVVLSVHCQGHILELTDLSYSDRPESESPVPIYWCLSSSRLSSAELCPGGHLVFHNIWYLPAPSSTGFSVGYEALLVLGVYSTCQIYQSTKPPGMQQPSSFPSPPCESRCCTDSRLVGPDAFHPINVREILSGCMHTWKSAQAHLKELNGRGSKSISKQFTDSILDRLISPDPDYQPQLAEEFINFPHLYGDSTFPDQSGFMVFTPDQFFDVFSTFPEPIESDETRFELADRQSCLVWRKRSSRRPLLDADTPSRWSWLFQESKTTLELSGATDFDPAASPWIVKSLQVLPDSDVLAREQQHQQQNGNPSSSVIIGRLVWDATDACYYIQSIPLTSLYLWRTAKLESTRYPTSDLSIPLILKPSLWMREPLPQDHSVVALLGCMLLSEFQPGSHEAHRMPGPASKRSSHYFTACQVVSLVPDTPSLPARQFEFLSISQSSICQNTICITRIGSASRQSNISGNPSWSYPMVVRLNPDQVQKSMLLTGPLARRWYCALKRGATYRVLWQWTNDATDVPRLTSLRPVPNKPLIDENICSHVMSPQDALILARSRSSDSSHTVTTIHVQGLLVHKTVDISHGWCLWCAQVEQTNDRTTIPHLVRIYIPPELDWTQWSVGFPGPLCRIWIYDLHWVRLRAANGVSVKLMASALSRLEWAPSEPRGLAYPNNAQSPDKIRLFRRDCSHCNALWKSSDQDDAAPVDSLIGAVFLSAEHGVLDSDHSLFVRASIVKCLEFQWYTPENQCATTDRSKTSSLPPLKIYTRFLISDGSGCALVEFGRPSSENDYPTFSHASRSDAVDSLELARSLFGIDSVNWRRLCLVLERELSSSRQRSLGKSFFAVPLKSLTGLQKLSPLMFALRSYLTSATFLRTHKFHLKRLFPGSWKSSAGLWRLRQVRLREGANDGNPIGGPGQMISFVVPPLQLFRLLSIDNDF